MLLCMNLVSWPEFKPVEWGRQPSGVLSLPAGKSSVGDPPKHEAPVACTGFKLSTCNVAMTFRSPDVMDDFRRDRRRSQIFAPIRIIPLRKRVYTALPSQVSIFEIAHPKLQDQGTACHETVPQRPESGS